MYQYFLTFGRYYTPSPQLHVQDSSSWLCSSCQRSIHNSKIIFAGQQHLLVHHVHWRTLKQEHKIWWLVCLWKVSLIRILQVGNFPDLLPSRVVYLLPCCIVKFSFTILLWLLIKFVYFWSKMIDAFRKFFFFLWYDSHVWRLIVSKKWLVTHITLYSLINKLGP